MFRYYLIRFVPVCLLLSMLACFFPLARSGAALWRMMSLRQSIKNTALLTNDVLLQSTNGTFRSYLPAVTRSADEEILALTNQLRAEHGCPPLALSSALSEAANEHSMDMATNNFLGHTGSDGSTPGKRLDKAGYTFTLAAENVAAGYQTPEEVVNAWYNESPPNDGHRQNILNCNLKEIGIGQAFNPNSTYRFYWTQDFGSQ